MKRLLLVGALAVFALGGTTSAASAEPTDPPELTGGCLSTDFVEIVDCFLPGSGDSGGGEAGGAE